MYSLFLFASSDVLCLLEPTRSKVSYILYLFDFTFFKLSGSSMIFKLSFIYSITGYSVFEIYGTIYLGIGGLDRLKFRSLSNLKLIYIDFEGLDRFIFSSLSNLS